MRNQLNFSGKYECADTLRVSAHQNGVERELLTIKEKRIVNKNSGVEFQVCYCSIYDDCWTLGNGNVPEPIPSCDEFEYNISC